MTGDGMAGGARSSRAELRKLAEQAAGAFPRLLVEAERIAATVTPGIHGRRRTGSGDAFWQYRRYQFGDPVSLIDWRQSAKRTRSYVRQNEWEAAESIWLWRDNSPSMHWQSLPQLPAKVQRASVLLVAIASLLVRGGERVGLLHEPDPPTTGRATLDRIAVYLTRSGQTPDMPAATETRTAAGGIPAATRDSGAEGDWPASLPYQRDLPRFARVIWFSDFLSPLARIEDAVRRDAARGVNGHLVQILDPAEEDLPFEGRVRFAGLEGEGRYTVDRVEAIRGQWKERLHARHEALRRIAAGAGWTFSVHRTDQPPQTALLALYAALSGDPSLGAGAAPREPGIAAGQPTGTASASGPEGGR
ncbi:DUF58 domain-containing protein [Marinibaculum pumilum]|uniref:DUF58 domain-containing protein n=1 Tax=Marinibaculum pumilum TaxID=1766165 RepID=A0ABV7L4R0_9PROT